MGRVQRPGRRRLLADLQAWGALGWSRDDVEPYLGQESDLAPWDLTAGPSTRVDDEQALAAGRPGCWARDGTRCSSCTPSRATTGTC
ncbi:MAG: hypothetical protein U5R31_00405 [Acidimicrobiia bacterium]|nr:hypothetical protein [Acidimicrobiia bacterium]